MDGDNGFSWYDGFAGVCDPLDPWCADRGGVGSTIIVTPPIVIYVNDNAAALGSVQNAVNALRDQDSIIIKISGLFLLILKGIHDLLKLIWDKRIKPDTERIDKALKKFNRWLEKILKPIRDALKAQRDALLNIYNKFIRPLIVFLETMRRFIALLRLFHIHLLDGLDAQLAKLERKIMEPFLRALGQINTIGNWVSFILNSRLLIFRNLFMRTQAANQGGSFSMFAATPAYGFAMLPEAPTDAAGATTHTDTFSTGRAAVNDSIPALQLKYSGTPIDDMLTCWKEPLGNIHLETAIDEMLTCLFASIPKVL